MRDFKELETWNEGMRIANEVHEITLTFPKNELYGLVSQLNRCAVSVPSNIAEGCSRSSNKDTARFMEIAIGSLFELETQLLLAKSRGYLKGNQETLFSDVVKLQKMTSSYRNYLLKSIK